MKSEVKEKPVKSESNVEIKEESKVLAEVDTNEGNLETKEASNSEAKFENASKLPSVK